MRKHTVALWVMALCSGLAACSAAAPALPKFPGVIVAVANDPEWRLEADEMIDGVRRRDWVRVDDDGEPWTWTVRQTDGTSNHVPSARAVIKAMMREVGDSCTSYKVNGPEELPLEGLDSWWGRVLCAQRFGRTYGRFTNLRVVVDGRNMHFIRSEVLTPPSPEAGVLSFEDATQADDLTAKFSAATKLSREGVHICRDGPC